VEITVTSIFLPRTGPSGSPGGASFLATVIAPAGPHQWKIGVGPQVFLVTSTLELVPGEVLKLHVLRDEPQKWIIDPLRLTQEALPDLGHQDLISAFLGQGLSLVQEKVTLWTRWLFKTKVHHPEWAASAASRGLNSTDADIESLEAWLGWLGQLEQGSQEPPPQDESFWDSWNLRRPSTPVNWLSMPLRWTRDSQEDCGFLQARWVHSLQRIDRWIVTAAPLAQPFRLDADVQPQSLDLFWWFFKDEDQKKWQPWTQTHRDVFSKENLKVTLHWGHRPLYPDAFERPRVNFQI